MPAVLCYTHVSLFKGTVMKTLYSLLILTLTPFLLASCGEETKERTATKSVGSSNPVDSYVDSRLNALDMAKDSVKQSNQKVKEQNKAMEALTK